MRTSRCSSSVFWAYGRVGFVDEGRTFSYSETTRISGACPPLPVLTKSAHANLAAGRFERHSPCAFGVVARDDAVVESGNRVVHIAHLVVGVRMQVDLDVVLVGDRKAVVDRGSR